MKKYLVFLVPLALAGYGLLNFGNRAKPPIIAMAFRGGIVEAISSDGYVHHFAPDSLEEISKSRKPIDVIHDRTAIAFSPDGQLLSVADEAGVVRVGPVDGALKAVVQATSILSGLAVSASGSSVAVTSRDLITIYREGEAGATITGGMDSFSSAMMFSPDGKILAVGLLNLDGPPGPTIRLYNVEDGLLIKSFGPPGVISALGFSPDGESLAFAGSPGNTYHDPSFVEIVNIRDGTTMAEWSNSKPYQGLMSLAFDGSLVVGSSFRGALRAFKLDLGRLSPP